MEDFALLNANVADPTLIGTLRGPGVENQPVTDTPANDAAETFGSNGTDIVEFSSESLQLSRLSNNEEAQQAAAGIPEADNSTDENPNPASNALTETPFEGSQNTEPFNLGELNDAATNTAPGVSPAEAAAAQSTGPGGTIATGPPGIDTGIDTNARGEFESSTFSSDTASRTSSLESTPFSVDNEGPEVGGVNNLELEPQNNSADIQVQADRLRALDSSLSNTNGQPSESPVTDVDRAQETSQFQEQLLLQNVGSQLAQTVPPASVVSILG